MVMDDVALDRPSASLLARTLRLGTFALAVLGLLLLLARLPHLIELLTTNGLSDVRAYYDAGARLNAGQPLYPVSADVNAAEFYRYPPLLAIVFRPLALLPFEVAAICWEVGMLAALLLTFRRIAVRPGFWRTIAILAFPVAWSLAIGQAQVLVTWLLVLATPSSVALAGQLKLLPALVAIYWLGVRDWRSLRRFVGWSLLLLAVQVILEPVGFVDFLGITNLDQVGEVNNLSPYAASPLLWAVLVVVGTIFTLRLAPTRHGWMAAVTLSVLATPRLLLYLVMALLAGLREPPDSSTRRSRGIDQ